MVRMWRPEAQRRLRKLYPVFGHVINKVWNDDLGGRVVDVLDTRRSVNVYHILESIALIEFIQCNF